MKWNQVKSDDDHVVKMDKNGLQDRLGIAVENWFGKELSACLWVGG